MANNSIRIGLVAASAALARIFHTRAWSIHTPRRFAPPLSVEGTRSAAGEIPSGEGCPTGRGVSVRIWKCEKPALGSFVANPSEWDVTGAEAAENDVVAWEAFHRWNPSAASASSCKVVVPTVLFEQEATERMEEWR